MVLRRLVLPLVLLVGLQAPLVAGGDAATPALPPDLDAAVRVHGEKARGDPSDALACALVADAEALVPRLVEHLEPRWEALSAPEVDVATFRAFEAQVAALAAGLPGIGLEVIGANALHGAVAYGELAPLAEGGAALLRAADALAGARMPPWIEQSFDAGGCGRLAAAGPALKAVAAAWPTAPPCLRDALRTPLAARIAALGSTRCFCDDRAAVERAFGEIAGALEALGDLGGPEALEALRAHLDGSTFSSDCAG